MAGILIARSIFLLPVKGTQHERYALNTRNMFGADVMGPRAISVKISKNLFTLA